MAALAVYALQAITGSAFATLPDNRGYELVSPAANNGVVPYAAIPSPNGDAVDFQARGAFSGATAGSLNLFQATRTGSDWQTASLTPEPTKPLGALEEQAPVWFSPDLTQTIFTTPESYASGDQDGGALSLYLESAGGTLTWLSRGTQGASAPNHSTFDGTTPDGDHVVFSSAASLLPLSTGLSAEVFPEAEYLYERNHVTGQTNLLSVDSGGQTIGSAATTLSVPYNVGEGFLQVVDTEGFFPGQTVTVGTGASAETTQIGSVELKVGVTPQLVVGNGSGLNAAYPAGTPIAHMGEGAILGNGAHLTSGTPPAGEYLAANAGSGSTTHAISNDGSRVFFEAPSPAGPEPVGLYVHDSDSNTVKIAGASPDGTTLSGFGEELVTFDSARFEGAAADGSLMFFMSEAGLSGATKGTELYAYNPTGHAVGVVPSQSVSPISTGQHGDGTPVTMLTTTAVFPEETITVASTAGFATGEAIAFGRFEVLEGARIRHSSSVISRIAAVKNATELVLNSAVHGAGFTGIPPGTEVHGVHPASLTAVSSDGTYVYFISDGVLAPNANTQGATATPVNPNLYVFDTTTGATTFIGTVAGRDVKTAAGSPTGLAGEPDISRPAIPTPDGGVLVFASAGNLTGENPWQQYTEIYRYTIAGNKLECLSCTAPGIKPTGNANFGETAGGTYDPPGLTSPISEDGNRVFFDTPDSLVPEDINGNAPLSAKFGTPTSTDVYEAENGKVFLLSSGKSTTPATLQGTTPSGDDVLFTTTAQMAPQDTDGGYENVWDARVDGGFPTQATGTPTCVGQNCRTAFGIAPTFTPPTSTTPQAAGNPPATAVKPTPKPLTCHKGLVKKHVKGKLVCAKKSARKASHAARSTAHGSSAGRASTVNTRRRH